MDSREALSQASALAQAGRLEAADQLLRQAFGASPKSAQVWHLKGLIALQRGRLAQAIKNLGKAVDLAPDPAVRTNLGIALAKAGRIDEAVAELRRAVAADAPYPPAFCNLGVALLRQGAHAEATEMLRRATTLQPDYGKAWFELGVALQEHEPDEALVCYDRVPERAPERADALYNIGVTLQTRGDFSGAAARFEALLAETPERAGAWMALGICRQEAGDLAGARVAYRAALQRDPALYPAILKSLGTASKGRMWLDPAVLHEQLLGQRGAR